MTDLGPLAPHDIALAVPRHWATHADPDEGIVLAARAPRRPPSGFAPELVLRAVPVTGDPERWRRQALVSRAPHLDRFEVEDVDEVDLAGLAACYRRFGHRVAGLDVVCDQWMWVAHGLGLTLTGSVARVEYADYCDVFEEVAATVEVTPVVRPAPARPDEGRW